MIPRQPRVSGGLGYTAVPYDAGIQRLRVLAASGGQPTAMSSPPTVTTGASGAATAIPVSSTYHTWNSGKFNLMGGTWALTGTVYPGNLSATARTVTMAGSTVYTVDWCGGGTPIFECTYTGRYFEPLLNGSSGRWRLIVNGEFVNLPTVGAGLIRTLIDFGSSATRTIRIEGIGPQQSDIRLMGVTVETAATLTATTAPADRLVLVGDSFFGTTGTSDPSLAADGILYKLAKQLGFSDFWGSHRGATGWEQASATPSYNLDDRFTQDVVNAAPTMAIIAMGLNDVNDGNDAAIQTMVAAKLDELRAARPNCLVHVFGPYDTAAPGGPIPGFTTLQTAIQNGCAGRPKVWFHSLQGLSFTKVDGTHPDTAGHTTLYKAMFNKIAAVHGLAQVA